MEQKRVQVVLY